ncbi:creatininase family protein [Salinarimonas ramus]|uniref:Creatininase n=1 Tax=Salinarimonas ramus TaxID=690164 RepID=A0A917QF33_9HYPH|nr:creatininase family protein [Salinarimonas ramus]GGK47621.1 creatininase [Salinarimonas ramus]
MSRTPTMPCRWQDLTTEDFRRLPADTVAILLTAAIEQHGPHLPVSVDTTILEGLLARALGSLSGAPVLVLPTMCVGKSDEHAHFPGTLTLDWKTTGELWRQVGLSVARAGVRRMMIVNSHGGQVQLIDVVARQLRIEAGLFVAAVHWPALWSGEDRLSEVERRHGIHGGLVETAMMLHLAPGLVRMEEARDFESWGAELDATFEILAPEGAVGFGWMSEDLHPAGALGDASAATAELGAEIVEEVAGGIARLVEEVRRIDLSRFDRDWTRAGLSQRGPAEARR